MKIQYYLGEKTTLKIGISTSNPYRVFLLTHVSPYFCDRSILLFPPLASSISFHLFLGPMSSPYMTHWLLLHILSLYGAMAFCSSASSSALHLIPLAPSLPPSFTVNPVPRGNSHSSCLPLSFVFPSCLYGSCFQIRQVLLLAWYQQRVEDGHQTEKFPSQLQVQSCQQA